jgi:hypothetical protein
MASIVLRFYGALKMNRIQTKTGLIGLVCALCLLLSWALIPLEAQGKRKPRATKSRKATTMLSDQEIKEALQSGATIALVKTDSTDVEAPGTRGHRTFYKLTIITKLTGQLTGAVEAVRYGAPILQKGQEAIVVLSPDSNGEHSLSACVVVPAGMQTEAVKAHTERIETLKAAK